MSRIMFCATPEGVARQVSALTTPDGDVPRRLMGGKDVLDALLALEMGMDVVADARSTSTGWRLPEGVEIGFDPDMEGPENDALRAQCVSRAYRIAPNPGLRRVTLLPDPHDGFFSNLMVRVVDPFGPHEPVQAPPAAVQAAPEAA
jgi:hypothetical protein